MEDYDVDMDEEEEGEVFTRGVGGGARGSGMVNSRSWAEELQDIFVQQAEETRRSSISVSDGTVFL